MYRFWSSLHITLSVPQRYFVNDIRVFFGIPITDKFSAHPLNHCTLGEVLIARINREIVGDNGPPIGLESPGVDECGPDGKDEQLELTELCGFCIALVACCWFSSERW